MRRPPSPLTWAAVPSATVRGGRAGPPSGQGAQIALRVCTPHHRCAEDEVAAAQGPQQTASEPPSTSPFISSEDVKSLLSKMGERESLEPHRAAGPWERGIQSHGEPPPPHSTPPANAAARSGNVYNDPDVHAKLHEIMGRGMGSLRGVVDAFLVGYAEGKNEEIRRALDEEIARQRAAVDALRSAAGAPAAHSSAESEATTVAAVPASGSPAGSVQGGPQDGPGPQPRGTIAAEALPSGGAAAACDVPAAPR